MLEVGTGSGYAAAVLSHCAAHVVSIERHAALSRRRRRGPGRARGSATWSCGWATARAGVPERAPFDAICVTASAHGPEPPAALREQLVPGGSLVCPVDRDGEERLEVIRDGRVESVAAVRFVPLVEGDG